MNEIFKKWHVPKKKEHGSLQEVLRLHISHHQNKLKKNSRPSA